MNPVTSQLAVVVLLISALGLGEGTAFAQSGGSSSGGGSSGGGSSGSGSSAGASRGGGSAASVGRTGAGSMAPRVRGTGSGVGTNDPRSLSNQPATSTSPGSTAPGTYAPGSGPAPAGTSTPSATGYPSGTALEAARQRALQEPPGTAVPPTAAGVGADRSSTSEVGSDSSTDAATPGLPNQAQANRDAIGPEKRTGGGSSNRQGATGATMQECEAAWDAKTHMSKDKWRETCSRTLTDPHL